MMQEEMKSVMKDAENLLREILGFWESGEPIHPRTAEVAQGLIERLSEQSGTNDAAKA
tara:strand:+ start:352 stop:525 length:174 start_codon:yes stop_codon:yes gene_type:complete